MNTLKHTGKIRNIETEQQTMYTCLQFYVYLDKETALKYKHLSFKKLQ